MFPVDTKALRKIMIDRNISTIIEFAQICGIDRNTASSVINGTSRPSSLTMDKIVDGLELSPEEAGRIFFTEQLT